MGLLFSMHLKRRTEDIHIYGMPGLDDIITTQLKYSRSVPPFRLHFHLLQADVPAVVYEDEVLTVETIILKHKLPCVGFVFREKTKPRRIDKATLPAGLTMQQLAGLKKGLDVTDEDGNVLYANDRLTYSPRRSRSYAYCSDTAYTESLIPATRGVDLMYHEATFSNEDAGKAEETQHSTAAQAGRIARKAEVGKLLLGHFSARYRELEGLLAEARAEFANSELAIEGETFSIPE
jgi:ribonuclease Z